jgi:hypothetical protein
MDLMCRLGGKLGRWLRRHWSGLILPLESDSICTHGWDSAMRLPLALHLDSHCTAVTGIDVSIKRPQPGHLSLRYTVSGRIGALRMPHVMASTRADELWRRTCFEAFVRESSHSAYYEFNFAPSTQWAAYGFGEYRSGKHVPSEFRTPLIEVESTVDRYILQASLDLERLPGLGKDAMWRLGLSAVIEEKNGDISYWALAHPPGKPDFHHYDCFALELAGA